MDQKKGHPGQRNFLLSIQSDKPNVTAGRHSDPTKDTEVPDVRRARERLIGQLDKAGLTRLPRRS